MCSKLYAVILVMGDELAGLVTVHMILYLPYHDRSYVYV